MVNEFEINRILEQAVSTGADFAELFLEDREESNIRSQKGCIQGVKTIRIYGAGIHILSGTESVYVYTNKCSYDDLMKAAVTGSRMIGKSGLKAEKGIIRNISIEGLKTPATPIPIILEPGRVETARKLRVMEQARKAALSTVHPLRQMDVDYFDTDQRIIVANTEGLHVSDRRTTGRLRMQVTVGDGAESFYNWEDYVKAQGFEAFLMDEEYEAFARDLTERTWNMMKAVPAPSCTVPVVLERGGCGTLWHESCGHSLEASAIVSGTSAFAGKIGEMVASPKVTLLDDGTIPGLYGSSAIDDEGHPRQQNVLIENGVLKQYLCDRLHGRMLNMESNGCGRRQNYTYAPTSRMSNTYLAPGEDDEKEMIRSIPEGLYVKTIGGGTGGMQFSLEVKEGYWIKNGQIDHQVKGMMLTGNGIDVIKNIDRVGKCLKPEMGGFCGAASGLVPTTSFQPRVRISHMNIGGSV